MSLSDRDVPEGCVPLDVVLLDTPHTSATAFPTLPRGAPADVPPATTGPPPWGHPCDTLP